MSHSLVSLQKYIEAPFFQTDLAAVARLDTQNLLSNAVVF
jgi:hypothetical protein